ncbi:unnamed protein product [Closterium sp. NIES-53]
MRLRGYARSGRVHVIRYMRQPTSSGYRPLGSTDSSEDGAESEWPGDGAPCSVSGDLQAKIATQLTPVSAAPERPRSCCGEGVSSQLGGCCCPTPGPAAGAPTTPPPLGLAVSPVSAPPEPVPPVSSPSRPAPPASSPPVSPPPTAPVSTATGCRGGEDGRGGKPGGVSKLGER